MYIYDDTDKFFVAFLKTLIIFCLGLFLCLSFCILFSPHEHFGIYIATAKNQSGYCIYEDVSWEIDPKIYCNNDSVLVMSVYNQMKKSLGKSKRYVIPKKFINIYLKRKLEFEKDALNGFKNNL